MVAGNVGEPAALMADALPLIEADESELAVLTCLAAAAAVLTGGHLIEESTRRAIASGTQAVLARCDLPCPIAKNVAGVAVRLIDRPVAAVLLLRDAVTTAATQGDIADRHPGLTPRHAAA